MLAQFLALTIALASFSLYMAAFFFPEVHRKYDLVWSGVGMFYALVLWVCAGRITGGVLLGQTASVALLGWLGWQTLSLRRSLTPPDQQTPLPGAAKTIGEAIQIKLKDLPQLLPQPLAGGLTKAQAWMQQLARPTPTKRPPTRSTARIPTAYKVPEPIEAAAELAVAEVSDVRNEAAAEALENKVTAATRSVTRRQQNPFANLRDRLQGKVSPPKAPKASKQRPTTSVAPVANDDFGEEGEAGEMVEMIAELEVIEVETAPIAAAAVSDDSPILENSENVIEADAILEEELQWEANTPVDVLPLQPDETAHVATDADMPASSSDPQV